MTQSSYTIKLFVGSLCFAVSVIYLLSITTNSNLIEHSTRLLNFVGNAQKSENLPPRKITIRIASVMCPKSGDKSLRQEMNTMMKSIAVSTLLYNKLDDVEFHFVLSNMEDGEYFKSTIKDYNLAINQSQLSLFVYSAEDAISKCYAPGMTTEEKFKGHYLRIFLPKILEGIDAVIYLDSDTIIAGNVTDLWNKFDDMNATQVVAMGPDITAENPSKNTWFGDIPYAQPKGLNSGVMLMNLTRMRAFGWSHKSVELYNDYVFNKRVKVKSDQRLINILLYYNPSIFYELPCHFNFWWIHCRGGFYCPAALTDEHGIQVLHGAGKGFDKGQIFHKVFQTYRDFDFSNQTSKLDIINRLMIPIKSRYDVAAKNSSR